MQIRCLRHKNMYTANGIDGQCHYQILLELYGSLELLLFLSEMI